MFQVEAGRSRVEPLQPVRATFGPETSSVVADHLDALLGEQLLPVRMREGTEDEPYLLAVDAAGQPVVVEVVPLLDEAACTRALRHAGRAARLSTQELGQAYRGGPERFAEHLARFRDTVPATALLSPSVRGGARLLLVCSEITEPMEDVAEFLLQPGWQVEILQVGVVHDGDGRRIVDVSPLVRTSPSRRSPETRGPAPTPSAVPTEPPAASDGALAPAPHQPEPVPSRPASAPVRRPSLHREPTGQHSVISSVPRAPSVVPPPFAGSVVRHAPDDGGPQTRELSPVPASSGPVAPADSRLAGLAAEIGEPMPLVWVRQRRGVRYEAVLRTDGLIELGDGTRLADPDAAARAVSGTQGPVDGWQVWHLDGGPSLRDALEL